MAGPPTQKYLFLWELDYPLKQENFLPCTTIAQPIPILPLFKPKTHVIPQRWAGMFVCLFLKWPF
jgi:hypothetical protein